MDKLRALHYFAAAAETTSFSAAARRFEVSTAAVAKLVSVLEAELGLRLFHRNSQGLVLTAAGASYLESCLPALQQLTQADELAVAANASVRGNVVLGVQPVIAQECLRTELPRFLAMYPDIQLDVRYFMRPTDEQIRGVDLMLVLGWPQADDLVQRQLGGVSFMLCASPEYWAAHGMPQHPGELAQHNCVCVRSSQSGAVMDLWRFQRGEEEVRVTARGNVVVDNAHRDLARDLILAGVGVGRILEWDARRLGDRLEGSLVPALRDWHSPEVPPITLLHPPSVRRVPRVRAVIDFLVQVFRDLERRRAVRAPFSTMPRWVTTSRSRTSAQSDPGFAPARVASRGRVRGG